MQCLKFFVVVFFATLAREALTKHLWHQIPMASWPNPLCWLMMTLLWHWWPDFFIIAKLSWGDRRIQWITMDWVSMVLHRYMKFEGQYNDRFWAKDTRRRICSCRELNRFIAWWIQKSLSLESQAEDTFVPEGVRILCINDCCHSGTICDFDSFRYSHDIYSSSAAKDDEEAEDVGEGGVLSCAMRRAVRTLSLEHGNQENRRKPCGKDTAWLVGGFTWFQTTLTCLRIFWDDHWQ